MPIGQADYELNFKTTADLHGVQDITSETENLSKAAEHAGEGMASIGKKTEKTGDQAKDAYQKQKHGAEEVTLSHRELREAVIAVGRQFGGLADVGLWLNPTTAGLAALLFLVDKLKNYVESLTGKVDQFQTSLENIDASRLKSAAESASQLASALGDIVTKEAELDAAYARGDTALANRIKLYGEQKDAILKVAEAQEKTYEAEQDMKATDGTISKEEAERRKEQARLQLDQNGGAVDQAKLKKEIDERQAELDDAKADVAYQTDLVKWAKRDEAKPHDAVAQAQANLENGQKQAITAPSTGMLVHAKDYATREELQTAMAENQQKQEELDNSLLEKQKTVGDLKARGMRSDRADADVKAVQIVSDDNKKEGEEMASALKAHDQYITSLTKEVAITKEAEAAAQSRSEIAAKQLEHTKEIIRSGPANIQALQAQYGINEEANRQVEAEAAKQAKIKDAARRDDLTDEAKKRQAAAEAREKGEDEQGAHSADSASSYAHESGPQAALDANAVITHARLTLATVRNQQGGRANPSQDAEMHDILTQISGLMVNQARELNGQRGVLQQVQRDVDRAIQLANRSPSASR